MRADPVCASLLLLLLLVLRHSLLLQAIAWESECDCVRLLDQQEKIAATAAAKHASDSVYES